VKVESNQWVPEMKPRINKLLLLLLGLVMAIPYGVAVLGEPPDPLLLGKPDQGPYPQDPDRTIKVDVNLVLVPVTVTDQTGRVVRGLEQDIFRLFDDRVPQQIVYFSNEDVPCSVGLLFDGSGSMSDKISKSRLAAQAFLESANPDDEVFLMTFADRPSMKVDFTSNFAAIQDRLLFANAKGGTALNDAVYLALERMWSAHNPRKALLVVSDGGDNHSRYSQRDLEAFARESDVQIHAIGIHDNPRFTEEMNGTNLLEGLTRMSGGLHFIIRDINELSDVAGKIGEALHDQYILGYYPPKNAEAGKWRKIKVKLVPPKGLPPLHVYTRNGYYAVEP